MVVSATFGLFMAFSAFGLSGCKNEAEGDKKTADCGELPSLEFSENLKIGKLCGEDFAEIRSIVGRDTLIKRFKLGEPLKRVVALSSSQVGYMLRLGLRDRIVAVGEGRYLVDSVLYARVAAGEVAEVGNGPTLSLEKLVATKPDLVFDFATGGGMDDYERIGAIGLSLMLTSEWQERSPLAKAEWIKLFGRLFGVEALADSIFEQSKNAYMQAAIKEILDQARDDNWACPRVLVGMSYGGVWHAPGGNSFTARLIKDAGGCYLWAADTNQDLQFSLEEILQVADSADVWVNPGMFATVEDLLMAEPRVKFIKAFKEKRVYQNDAIKGAGGGNDFFESAVAYPAEILTNLRLCIQNSTNGADSTRKGFDWYHNIFIF
ncbi:ABC transporter substrate-binding protein [Fibrobacter succinogenes]|uniref:ABC transporter substrate-binding protein n=1 Tax=Fibrobacter succinogenes TaxID=833 RepID=UPI0013D8C7FE|nr:ABC transporter substrate-binding protein [Fibrobacter succinogenes]